MSTEGQSQGQMQVEDSKKETRGYEKVESCKVTPPHKETKQLKVYIQATTAILEESQDNHFS